MAGGGVCEALLDEAAVDHMHDAVDGDRGLRYVGRDHHLARAGRRRREDAHLLLGGEPRVDGERQQAQPRARAGGLVGEQADRGVDLLLAREEDEDVALWLALVELPRGVHGVLEVVGQRRLGEVHRHLVHAAARQRDDRGRVSRGVCAAVGLEEGAEDLRVDRGGGDDQAELRPLALHALEQPEQHVRVHRALVRLVHHDDGVPREQRV